MILLLDNTTVQINDIPLLKWPVSPDKLCLQTSIGVLMMKGYALGTAPHSAAAWHAAHLILTATWSSACRIPAVEGHTSSFPLPFGPAQVLVGSLPEWQGGQCEC